MARCLLVTRWPRLHFFMYRHVLGCWCCVSRVLRAGGYVDLLLSFFSCVVVVFFALFWDQIVLFFSLLFCCCGWHCVGLLSSRFFRFHFCVYTSLGIVGIIYRFLPVFTVLFFLFLICFWCSLNLLFRCIFAGMLWFFVVLSLPHCCIFFRSLLCVLVFEWVVQPPLCVLCFLPWLSWPSLPSLTLTYFFCPFCCAYRVWSLPTNGYPWSSLSLFRAATLNNIPLHLSAPTLINIHHSSSP